ncbi:Uncharacterised protein [Candidatus Ornithobacterium hominis]|uniref:Uncharacterized protein n=1 Tax=Candidatus Ornithobacterium hominis TaxID=2497989 RepID=A0A383U4D8_9FLAO|nr:DUF5074 domain-containing protein [Candidatus Ornithobacterium hominis]MCT7904636.1 hypothetical protein [Candidatus Ornithobacterium hominis]SZD74021.1 Uncharacterised protein [Candidatus Ornithobacterium hominis]
MNYFSKMTVFAVALFTVFSCTNSDEDVVNPSGKFVSTGILISNEGNFGSANASIDILTNEGELQTDVFKKSNENKLLGDVLQGAFIDKDYTYLVVNNSNKVEILEKGTHKIKFTITEELNLPRYVTVTNDYILVTNNKSTYAGQSDGYVSVYKKGDFSFHSNIEFPEQIEKIFSNEKYIYVQQSYFSTGNKIVKLDASTLKKLDEIVLAKNFSDMSWGTGKYFYALSNGESKCNDFSACKEEINGEIYQIEKSTGTISKTFHFNSYATNIDHYYDDQVFFTTSNQVYKINTKNKNAQPESIIQTEKNDWSNFYGFSVLKNKIYLSNVNGFIASSDVYIYNNNGNLEKEFKGGRGVNDFYLY